MPLVKCPDCGREVSDQAPSCPNCGRPMVAQRSAPQQQPKKSSSWLPGCLLLAFLGFCGLYVLGSNATDSSGPSLSNDLSSASTPSTPKLEVTNWTWHREYGYAIVEGEVRNISGASMDNVTAVASFYGADQSFVSSDDALIDYRPLLAGQSSPFKVMATWNPAMKSANIDFREFGGRAIMWRAAEKK